MTRAPSPASSSRKRPPKTTSLTEADLTPRRVAYEVVIYSAWGEPGQSAFNLKRECQNLRARPDLMDASEHAFVRHLEKHAIRNGNEVWLSPLHERRLAVLAARYTTLALELAWRRKQAAKQAGTPARFTEEAVDAEGRWSLPTRVL